MHETARIGIIGGSGLYQMEALQNVQTLELQTPFGKPSDAIVTGTVEGAQVAFLARHGRGHRLQPSEVPYRANIHALKQLGVKYLLSFSAVGSLKAHIGPLDMVIPDQFIDLTRRRESTFFGDGAVAHVSMAQPVCPQLCEYMANAVASVELAPGARLHRGGTYLCIEGPQFSTQAESQWFRGMDASVIGMTNMPEAKLAREAQMAYVSLAMVTDYDCWHPRQAHVSADSALANLMKNAGNAQKIAVNMIAQLGHSAPVCEAHSALQAALVTPRSSWTEAVAQRLGILLT